jgi:hypothetical protein
MSFIEQVTAALAPCGIAARVGVHSANTSENYIVITPLSERNEDIADDDDLTMTSEADVNLYYIGNYETTKNQIIALLKSAGFYIADRRYIGYESDTRHHHYVVTVEKKEVL